MIAIDIEAFMPHEEFDERLERLVADVKSAPPLDSEYPVRLPGEAEQWRARERMETGIPIEPTLRFPRSGLAWVRGDVSVIPKPSMIVDPVSFSKRCSTSGAIGAEPERQYLTLPRSTCSMPGWLLNAL